MSPVSVAPPSIKPFIISAAASFATLLASAVTGAVVYGRDPLAKPPPGAIVLGVLVFAALLLFAYALVPILVRTIVRGQILIGNGDAPALRWLQANEKKVWWVVWALWSAGLALALPFAIQDWSANR